MTNNHKNFASWLLLGLVLLSVLLCVASRANAQETFVSACATKPACTLTQSSGPVSWALGNQVWIAPLSNGTNSVRIWIRNLNPTNGHTSQTVSVFTTDDSNATSLLKQADRWVQAVVTDNVTTNAKCTQLSANAPAAAPGADGKGTCYVIGMFGSAIAIQISGAAGAAGNPDTFELGLYQGTGLASGPQPGDRLYEVSGLVGPGVGVTSINPVLVGCDVGPQAITQATATNQFIGCDVLGNLQVVGPVAPGISAAGLNPLLMGVMDGGSTLAHPVPGQSIASQSTSSSPGAALFGMPIVTGPAAWTVPVQATTASNCSASQAAAAGFRHCATGVIVCVSATAAQVQLFANLRDGATGAGTVKWNGLVGASGLAGGTTCVTNEFSGGPICGSSGTAMTLELSAATAATNGCATTVKGYDIN